jgi:hypothetical protein
MFRGIMPVPVSFMRVCYFTIDFIPFTRILAASTFFFLRCSLDGLDYMAFKVVVFPVLSVEFQFNLSGLLSAYLECCC